MSLLYLTQALNAVLLLPLLSEVRRLASDPTLLGPFALRPVGHVGTAAAILAVAACVGALLVQSVR